MSRTTDHNRLLVEVLAEAEPPEFRDELLGETLRLVGRRRRVRFLRRSTVALAVAGLLGTLGWQILMPASPIFTHSARSYTLVRTAPFPGSAIVATQRFSNDRIHTSVASATVVRTTSDDKRSRIIDDDTLLALVAPRPAALVRVGPHSAKLIFVGPNGSANSEVN